MEIKLKVKRLVNDIRSKSHLTVATIADPSSRYNAEAGSDIICAAVSALCYTAAGYFESAKPEGIKYGYEEKDGYMMLELSEVPEGELKVRAKAVMDAWLIGVKQIRYSYGGKYIRIIDTKTGGKGYA